MRKTAYELAAEFDAGFAAAHAGAPPVVDLLAIGVGPERGALRLADIAGVFVDRPITKVPSRRAELLGLAAFRGSVVPVFDLARCLGYTAVHAPRWLVLAAAAPIAFAFERFDGHLRLAREAAGDVVTLDGAAVPVVDIAQLARGLATQGRGT